MTKEKNPFEGVDHSDFTEEEKQQKGIETDAERDERVTKAKPKAKKEAKPKAKKEAKPKAKKEAKPKAKKDAKPKAKKDAKPKAKKEAAPLGLRADGQPRLKKPFDPETTLGQKGKKLDKEEIDLNENESSVLSCVRRAGTIDLATLAERAFPKNKKCNSWTRNALRRLIRARLVKKAGRGQYEKAA